MLPPAGRPLMRLVAAVVMLAGCGAGEAPASSSAPGGSHSPDGPSPIATPRDVQSGSPAHTPRDADAALAYVPAGSRPGQPLGYLEHLPAPHASGAPPPLLVFLHGNGQGGDGSAAALAGLTETGIPRLIADGEWPAHRPFVVLMPQHAETGQSPCMEASEIRAFLDFALDHYAVDPARVYLTGVSCGAIGIWEYLARYRDEVVAATVPIAGDGRLAFAVAGCELGRVPVWALHGAADEAIPPEGSTLPIRELQRCTAPPPVEVRLTIVEGADHAMWQPIYDGSAGTDIYAWLLSH